MRLLALRTGGRWRRARRSRVRSGRDSSLCLLQLPFAAPRFVGLGLPRLSSLSNRRDDVGVGGATTQIAAHSFADLVVVERVRIGGQLRAHCAGPSRGGLTQHPYRRADLARRAVATLERVVADEGSLERVEVLGVGRQTCPRLALLATSRVPLRLRWEQTLRVAPLPVPDSTAPLPSLDALLAIPSVALFVGRARARQADFVLREQHAPLVAQVVVQLDGLPLALELAAARLDVLSLSALARRLGDHLQLLALEAPDLPERQQSLEAAVGW